MESKDFDMVSMSESSTLDKTPKDKKKKEKKDKAKDKEEPADVKQELEMTKKKMKVLKQAMKDEKLSKEKVLEELDESNKKIES